MKQYLPKKKKYNTLGQLHEEMITAKVKPLVFDGDSIRTKSHRYSMLDSQIVIRGLEDGSD